MTDDVSNTNPTLFDRMRDLHNPQSRKEAWDEFVAKYGRLVWDYAHRYAARRGGKSAGWDGDDLAQDVLRKLIAKAMDGFRYDPERGRFRDWLREVIYKTWCSALRRRVPDAAGDLDEVEASGVDLADHLEPAVEREHVGQLEDRVWAVFTPPTWKAYIMLVYGGLTAKEVAAAIGLTPEAAYAAKARVVERLKKEWKSL